MPATSKNITIPKTLIFILLLFLHFDIVKLAIYLKYHTKMSYRIEKDTMGEVQVPAEKYWGAQTQRSRNNFKIGPEASMPIEIVVAFAYLKKPQRMQIMN